MAVWLQHACRWHSKCVSLIHTNCDVRFLRNHCTLTANTVRVVPIYLHINPLLFSQIGLRPEELETVCTDAKLQVTCFPSDFNFHEISMCNICVLMTYNQDYVVHKDEEIKIDRKKLGCLSGLNAAWHLLCISLLLVHCKIMRLENPSVHKIEYRNALFHTWINI